MRAPLLEVSGIHKRFGATQALAGVDLRLEEGMRLALLGENGAGKSTLIHVLGGAIQPDAGSMRLCGEAHAPRDPRSARARGIELVHQELALCPGLSIEENLFLGREPRRGWRLDARERRRLALLALKAVDRVELDPARKVETLSIAEQQWIELARAFASGARVLVLDEPTSSLARADVTRLFELVREFSEQGCGVLYVSHALEEVRELCTDWTVLRDGRSVAQGRVAEASVEDWIAHMAGRRIDELYPRSTREPREELLKYAGREGCAPLCVRRGEVVGLYGLIGAGRSELLREIFGLDRLRGGELEVLGERGARSVAQRWRAGVGMVSEERAGEGLALERSLADNLTLPSLPRGGWFSTPAARHGRAETWRSRFSIRSAHTAVAVRTLSGGNQQKIAIARLLDAGTQLFLLDEPTRGVDVSAKSEIYRCIDGIAARGEGGVLLVSSYAPELLGVCDTIHVMHAGRLLPARGAGEWTQASLVEAAFGRGTAA